MIFPENKIKNKDYYLEAKKEWEEITEDQQKYVLYLLQTNKKYSNPNNSSLLYALSITNEKPECKVKREGGGGLCDIDTDFEQKKRHLVIQYVIQKYGVDYVCGIGTIGKMKTKKAIQKVTSALGLPIAEGEEIRKLVLPPVSGKYQDLKTCYEKVPELAAFRGQPSTKGVILNWAEKFENRVAEVGQHPAGIIISDEVIHHRAPLYKPKKGNIFPTQWDMEETEEAGLIKFDFLGIAALDKISTCLELIRERHNITIDINNIPHDDQLTYDVIKEGNLLGMFQLETSSGMRDLTIQVKPGNLEDLGVLVAAYRPGPLGSDALQKYLEWRNGGPPNYLIPEFEEILSETGGFMVYQEQISKIGMRFAGYTAGEADILRKGVAKKKPEVLAKEEKKFKKGWIDNGYPKDKVDIFWENLLGFASYCFNKCLPENTLIASVNNTNLTIKEINDKLNNGEKVFLQSFDAERKEIFIDECLEVIDCGEQDVYEIQLDNETIIECTLEHKFMCADNKMHTVKEIIDLDLDIKICDYE